MDISDLIARHHGRRSHAQLARDVVAAVAEQGDTVTTEAVHQWRRGETRPTTEGRAIGLARALGIDETEVFDALGWKPPSAGIHQRVERIEVALKAHGILTADGQVAPVPGTAELRGRRSDVPVGGVEPVEDDTDTTAGRKVQGG